MKYSSGTIDEGGERPWGRLQHLDHPALAM